VDESAATSKNVEYGMPVSPTWKESFPYVGCWHQLGHRNRMNKTL